MYGYTDNRYRPQTLQQKYETYAALKQAFRDRRENLDKWIDDTIERMIDDSPHAAHNRMVTSLWFWCDRVIDSHRAERHLSQFVNNP